MVLNALAVNVPSDMMGNFVHDGSNITTTTAHMLPALHTDTIE